MSLFDTFDADLQSIMNDWPDSLTYGEDDYPCSLVSMSSEDIEVLKYQFSETYALSVQVRSKDFPAKKGNKITYQGTEYRIGQIDISTDRNELKLHLTGVNG